MQSRRRLRRYSEHEVEVPHDRWLISYADFITLLFAFFVVMYAISSINQSKYQQFSYSLEQAFQPKATVNEKPQALDFSQEIQLESNRFKAGQLRQKTLIIAPIAYAKKLEKQQRAIDENLKKVQESLIATLSTLIKSGKISLQNTAEGVRVNMLDGLLFPPGSSELQSTDALLLLKSLTPTLKASQLHLRIEGHTDNQPIHNIYFHSNWALSAMRANQVLEVFNNDGIEDHYLSAISFGASRPVATNNTLQGRSQNRRVSILLVRPQATLAK